MDFGSRRVAPTACLVEHKKTHTVRPLPATQNGIPVKPAAVRCRTSNACFRRSIFRSNRQAVSYVIPRPYAANGIHNFLHRLGGLLHFATNECQANWPLCTVERAVRGGPQRNDLAALLQPRSTAKSNGRCVERNGVGGTVAHGFALTRFETVSHPLSAG